MNSDNLFSQIFGKVAKLSFIRPVQEFINSSYIKFFKIDMSEFSPAGEYKNLNELFTRELMKPREFDAADEIFISPSDGTCLSFGSTNELKAFSIKGMSYGVKELWGRASLMASMTLPTSTLVQKTTTTITHLAISPSKKRSISRASFTAWR